MATKITRQEVGKLKGLVRHDGWDVLVALAAAEIGKWRAEGVVGDDEFQVLRHAFNREGRIDGLTRFLEYVERMQFDDKDPF